MNNEVKVWEEVVVIPTYGVGRPEKNPMFLEKRVYQGSSGVVYPHAVIEKIFDEKSDASYSAVFLENQFLKIMILPELGGRIQMAYDKIKNRHFIYYNQVIKPALVGLTGPWISGGIEFNWPQHHRPSTFEPVDHTIIQNPDGSKTVWVNEVERMFRTKGMAGFTLYPDKAYIEIKGRLYNRTPFPQTFLWWANPAVKVNEHYQTVFPPDVYAVFDHGKRDVSSFPIAKGTYYKVDYSPGTDISRYKNIPVPTSYMAIASRYDFIGGYEHDTQGGLLHVADHHISPGKKQWTWGHGRFGQAWDKNLTDEDGPYIELMTGIFTDNQPDFCWLKPQEEKTFTQYFMPYSEVGVVKNASKDAFVNLSFSGNSAEIKVYVTSIYGKIKIELAEAGNSIFSESVPATPLQPYIKQVVFGNFMDPSTVRLTVTDTATGKLLVSYQPEKLVQPEAPSPAIAAKKPAEVENNEQLFLTGQHLEQYRHATFVAADYYEEALKRDHHDIRNNNALGLWLLRRGKFSQSEAHFRKSIATLTQRNPNPYDGEPYYNLGWTLMLQGKVDDAFDAFYKSVWNDAWQHAGYFNLARIASLQNNLELALELVEKSLIKNQNSHSVRHLKAVILRKMGNPDAALQYAEESITEDPFNFGCIYEKYLLLKNGGNKSCDQILKSLKGICRDWVHNYIEYALDYSHAGFYDEAIQLLLLYSENKKNKYPIAYYFIGWFFLQLGKKDQALDYFRMAAALSPDFCFPNRLEELIVLEKAMELNPSDWKAPYYLGNFWYDKRQYDEAIKSWERSVSINDGFPTVYRNLSLAYYNKLNDPNQSLVALEKAFDLDKSDARILMELDQLHKKLNTSALVRLKLLDRYPELVTARDDLYLEKITLYNQSGEYEKARKLIEQYKFHPWEGGEGKVVGQYLFCHIELAKLALETGRPDESLLLLSQAENYPSNLGEGKLYGAQENDIFYLKGLAYEQSGRDDLSRKFFQLATNGISEPAQAIFYNDPQPDKIFYQGMAWLKLGDRVKANNIFNSLVEFGKKHYDDKILIDYFAVSLPDLLVFEADLDIRNKIHCKYMMGLGYLGLGNGNFEKAEGLFKEVLTLDCNHAGALVHHQLLNYSFVAEQ